MQIPFAKIALVCLLTAVLGCLPAATALAAHQAPDPGAAGVADGLWTGLVAPLLEWAGEVAAAAPLWLRGGEVPQAPLDPGVREGGTDDGTIQTHVAGEEGVKIDPDS